MSCEVRAGFCSIYINRKMDLKRGLICSNTNQLADIEEECPEFGEDSIRKDRKCEEEQKIQKNLRSIKPIYSGMDQ